MKYVKIFFSLIVWSDGSCYAFSDTKRSNCSLTFKDGSAHSFKFTSARTKDSGFTTIWLNDGDGNALTSEDAELYRTEMCGDGDSCWGVIHSDGTQEILSQEQYDALHTTSTSDQASSFAE